jgi:hypothetical protein
MASRAAMPRADIARFMERRESAVLITGARKSAGSKECVSVKFASDVVLSEYYAPGRASYTSTIQPLFASEKAARHPTGPAPTIIALRRCAVNSGVSITADVEVA